MTKWKQTISINEHLSDDVSAEGIKRAAAGVTCAIKAASADAPIAGLQKASEMADEDSKTALLVFNDALHQLYDWADWNRVWLD